jgi:phosphate-selective porin OprO/OprP
MMQMLNQFCACLLLLVAAVTAVAATEDNPATIKAGSDGFSLSSADDQYQLQIRGLLHVDGRYFVADSAPGEDSGFVLRRARLSFDGKFGKGIGFRLRPEASNGVTQLIDAYVDATLGDSVTLRAGKFKPPVGLERLQSANDLRFIERSFVTELVPSRDVGVQISGSVIGAAWDLGIFNGVLDGRTGDIGEDGNQELAARLFAEPFKRSEFSRTTLGLGIGASYGNRDGTSTSPLLSGYRSPGQNTIFSYRGGADATFADGERWRISPQAYWYHGPFGILGEWVCSTHNVSRAIAGRTAELDQDAWQITGEWNITGDDTNYRGAPPAGTIQLVARVQGLDIDDAAFDAGADSFADPAAAIRHARTAGLGLNWFPLSGIKTSLVYELTRFDGGSPDGDRSDEQLVLMRVQLAY